MFTINKEICQDILNKGIRKLTRKVNPKRMTRQERSHFATKKHADGTKTVFILATGKTVS